MKKQFNRGDKFKIDWDSLIAVADNVSQSMRLCKDRQKYGETVLSVFMLRNDGAILFRFPDQIKGMSAVGVKHAVKLS